MQFIDINIPNEFLRYLQDGRVVFFCGAGISMNANLPSFKGLCRYVLNDFGISKPKKDSLVSDAFIVKRYE